MYLDFYGLRERPFSETPDPRFLFLTPGHREALAAGLFPAWYANRLPANEHTEAAKRKYRSRFAAMAAYWRRYSSLSARTATGGVARQQPHSILAGGGILHRATNVARLT